MKSKAKCKVVFERSCTRATGDIRSMRNHSGKTRQTLRSGARKLASCVVAPSFSGTESARIVETRGRPNDALSAEAGSQ